MGLDSIKKKIMKNPVCYLARREYWRIRGAKEYQKYDDYSFIRMQYKTLGRELNLVDPQRYTEKLQWLKLFYRNKLMPICSDKYEVRQYLTERGYGYLLNNLIAVYDRVEDFDPSVLPDRFVIKATHGSGWNLIVKDKNNVNWFWWKKIMRSWLKQDLSWFGREWNYHEQKHRIVVEKYLEDDSGELRDYKIFCFNGKPTYIQMDENRSTNHKRIYTDVLGNHLEMGDSQGHNTDFSVSFTEIHKEMVQLAAKLSKPFPNVRVDFYECDGKIYFGEMTFFDGSGFFSFNPDHWDFVWGEQVHLPEPNYNLELLNKLRNN